MHSLVCGMLLLVCVDMVSTLGTFCGHVDAYVCKAWLVECCCLSVVCQRWLFHLCIFDRFGLNMYAMCKLRGHVDAHACKALFVDCCCLSVP